MPLGHIDFVEALQRLKVDNDNLRAQLKTEHDERAADFRAIDELRQEIAELRQEIRAR